MDKVEKARQQFMRGEISATEYWDIRAAYYTALLEKNKKRKEVENEH